MTVLSAGGGLMSLGDTLSATCVPTGEGQWVPSTRGLMPHPPHPASGHAPLCVPSSFSGPP